MVCKLGSHFILTLVATRMTLGWEFTLFSLPLSVSTRNIRRDRYQFFMLSVWRQNILEREITQTTHIIQFEYLYCTCLNAVIVHVIMFNFHYVLLF